MTFLRVRVRARAGERQTSAASVDEPRAWPMKTLAGVGSSNGRPTFREGRDQPAVADACQPGLSERVKKSVKERDDGERRSEPEESS